MGIKDPVTVKAADPTTATPAIPTTPQAAAPATKPEEKPAPAEKVPEINIKDLTDDQINAWIEERTGKKVSLADLTKPELKTKEDLEKEAIQRKSDALSWAIENKKLTQKQYEDAVIGKNTGDRDLTLKAFTAELQAEDKDITAEEAEEMFKDFYHENDSESRLFKSGQKEIKKFADSYRKQNFGIMDEIESEYTQYDTLQSQYKEYKSTVKKLAADIPKEMEYVMPYKYLDGEESTITYKVPVDDKIFNKLLADASSEVSFLNENTDGKFDEKTLAKKLTHNLKASMYDLVISAILEQNTKEVEKRMEVVLGNKRFNGPQINSGRQETTKQPVKPNTYSALERAMGQRR